MSEASERIAELERRVAGWESAGRVASALVVFGLMGLAGWGLARAPVFEKVLEDMLGPGAALPVLTELRLSEIPAQDISHLSTLITLEQVGLMQMTLPDLLLAAQS